MQEYSAGLSTKRPDQEEKAGAMLAPILAAQAGFLMSHHPERKVKQSLQKFPGNTNIVHCHFLLKIGPFISIRHERLINSHLYLPVSEKVHSIR